MKRDILGINMYCTYEGTFFSLQKQFIPQNLFLKKVPSIHIYERDGFIYCTQFLYMIYMV